MAWRAEERQGMEISSEMIEEAAEAGWREEARLFGKIRLRSDARLSDQAPSTQEKWRAYARAMVLASVPALRKQVLEECAKVCDEHLAHLIRSVTPKDDQDDAIYSSGGRASTRWVASAIRSLMDKE